MYSVYQHWDPLKVCLVGKSYPPEFYSWIKNPKTRSIFERIAQETEEDYQSLIKLLEKFNVEVLRPKIPSDIRTNDPFPSQNNAFPRPPMTPRDYTGMYGSDFYHNGNINTVENFYNSIKDSSWPQEIKTIGDIKNLPLKIQDEINDVHWRSYYAYINLNEVSDDDIFTSIQYNEVFNKIIKNTSSINLADDNNVLSTASTVRIGKDLYFANDKAKKTVSNNPNVFNKYRKHFLNTFDHTDGVLCPVVPGLIVSLYDIPSYQNTFPDWEVIYLKDQSWSKVKPFLDLKRKNNGKWWIPGEEYNDDVIEVVDTWMSKWVGYVEETVFDVNMLVIDEKNVVVNNYNKLVFDAFDRYGITPHICNFRHRYFWDGGLHCITSDLDREGEMKDYFPERG